MALLDSLIAFALTLAALATVVTILMEIAIRILGLKRKEQVEMIHRLVTDVVDDYLPQREKLWDAAKGVLKNPFAKAEMASEKEEQRYWLGMAGAIYSEVSLEHVLRRLLETAKREEILRENEEELKANLEVIAAKYEEFCSAMSANFKRWAQFYSIFLGMGVALAMNVDGVRLLTTYLQDPGLRQSVIERLPAPSPNATAETSSAQTGDEIDAYIGDLKMRLSDISDLELPIGAAYFPHCQLSWLRDSNGTSPDPLCQDDVDKIPGGTYLLWILKVLTTGILIGLGAPFWYDVARRLAAVRAAFGGRPSGEERYRGEDLGKATEARQKLLDAIVRDAKTQAAKGTQAANG